MHAQLSYGYQIRYLLKFGEHLHIKLKKNSKILKTIQPLALNLTEECNWGSRSICLEPLVYQNVNASISHQVFRGFNLLIRVSGRKGYRPKRIRTSPDSGNMSGSNVSSDANIASPDSFQDRYTCVPITGPVCQIASLSLTMHLLILPFPVKIKLHIHILHHPNEKYSYINNKKTESN